MGTFLGITAVLAILYSLASLIWLLFRLMPRQIRSTFQRKKLEVTLKEQRTVAVAVVLIPVAVLTLGILNVVYPKSGESEVRARVQKPQASSKSQAPAKPAQQVAQAKTYTKPKPSTVAKVPHKAQTNSGRVKIDANTGAVDAPDGSGNTPEAQAQNSELYMHAARLAVARYIAVSIAEAAGFPTLECPEVNSFTGAEYTYCISTKTDFDSFSERWDDAVATKTSSKGQTINPLDDWAPLGNEGALHRPYVVGSYVLDVSYSKGLAFVSIMNNPR